jgi:transcriptional regulator with XRE-family HTH domain
VGEQLRAAFGRRVRELRHRLDLSQEELAERAGLHWTYVGGIERGERNPALVNIGKLARALRVSLAEFWSSFDGSSIDTKRRTKR